MIQKQIQDFQVKALIPYAANAKIHSKQQVDQIVKSIRKFGFYNPIIIDEAGEILCGHGRRLACIKMKMKTVPVIMVSDLTESERRALRLADNKISDNGSWDLAKVRDEIGDLLAMDFDVLETGFADFEIESLLREDFDILPNDSVVSVKLPAKKKATPAADDDDQDAEELERPRSERKPRPPKEDSDIGDDDYSRFDLVMLKENKNELIEVLSDIQEANVFDRMEDALMHLVQFYKQAAE